jgi:hypothetical protein
VTGSVSGRILRARRAPISPARSTSISRRRRSPTRCPSARLALGRGQSETIRVVYVRLPELAVSVDRQRYTCLEPGRRYRYESVDSDFARDIEVDDDGLVVTYPGLFRRVH